LAVLTGFLATTFITDGGLAINADVACMSVSNCYAKHTNSDVVFKIVQSSHVVLLRDFEAGDPQALCP
jgi:hypothetical protein